MGVEVDTTFKSLEKIWQQALSRRCNVLALTVPETHGHFPKINEKRADLNSRILNYKAAD